MRENWKYLPLGEITTSINGLWKGKKPPFVNVGVIRNANFTKEFTLNLSNIEYLDVEERQYSSRKLQRGDLIVEKSGGSEKQPVGRTILFDLEGEYSVSNFTSILRIKDKTSIQPTFLYKYLLYIYKEGYTKEMQNATTGIHNIIYDKFLSIPIPILSLTEQERIVALLDDQFAKIDALKANAASQLQAAKDLFQLHFKQIIEHIGEYQYYTLGEICTTINGLWKGKKPPFVNVGVIRNANFTKDFTLNFSNIEYLDVEERQFITRRLERGDLIVEKSGGSEKQPVGRTILFDADGDFSVSNFTSILRIKDKNIMLPKFLYLYILYEYKEGVTKEMQNATTGIHNIIFDKFLAIKVPILPIKIQEKIIANSEKLIDRIKALQENYNQTLNLCNDLKQSLLKSIFE